MTDLEREAEQARLAEDAWREGVRLKEAAEEPEQQQEWIRQNNVIYGGLIAIGLVWVQPFLTATSLDWSARICVIAFSMAIPLLAGLILVNRQEEFRRRVSGSWLVRVTQSVGLLLGFVGVVAGFWHVTWVAGVGFLVCGVVAMMAHSSGYLHLERAGLRRVVRRRVRRGERPAGGATRR